MTGGRVCTRTLWALKKPSIRYTEKARGTPRGSYGIPHKMVRVEMGIFGGFECAVIDRFEISDWFKI